MLQPGAWVVGGYLDQGLGQRSVETFVSPIGVWMVRGGDALIDTIHSEVNLGGIGN